MREALGGDGNLGEIEQGIEYAPAIIHSIVTGTERVIYGNVSNDALIDDLPAGACVEVPCVVDGTGVRPTRIGSLPPQCAALNRTFLNVCDLAVRAALEGSRERLIQAALLDPNAAATLDPDTIATVCDELAEAHGLGLAAPVRA
jgi:alpha-galactosidase